MKRPFLLLILLVTSLAAADLKPIQPVSAVADSERSTAPASKAIDGGRSDASRWLSSAEAGPHWIELTLPSVQRLGGIYLFSGYQGKDPITDFSIHSQQDGAWVEIPSAVVIGNQETVLRMPFDAAVDVVTDRLRIQISRTPKDVARIAEIVVWPYSAEGIPQLPDQSGADVLPGVLLNQSGFDDASPKRFTAPNVADGTAFVIRAVAEEEALYRGTVTNWIGDFTSFVPGDDREYEVVIGEKVSVPFRVGPWWLERVTYQGAVDFMMDSRHYVGTYRGIRSWSYGWRDDHAFGWELNTLVPQWLSNPSAYTRMPRQIRYEAPKNPALWGRLDPPAENAPDIVKLIHWGADVIVTQELTHEFMKAQLAYFLEAWPTLSEYLPEQNYRVVSDFAFAHWADAKDDQDYRHDESPEHDLFALKTKIGSTKGAYPPGFSIEPNLLMHEVALKEGRPDAQRYLDAAVNQADWMVKNLDWNDPQTTKGQRVGELVTMTGLARLLATYPDSAPQGLHQKIEAWVDVVIRRSDNPWDFRKLGDQPDQWVPSGPKPHMWNEVGNVVGLPAAIMAAMPFVDDPAKSSRLEEILWAHFDAMFGRNPLGRHYNSKASSEIEGVELGWFNRYKGGNGQLEWARFVLDGCAKNVHFPNNPGLGNVGWTEGWIQHNTPFNLGLAYLAKARSQIAAEVKGDHLTVSLVAPLNFDYVQQESGVVVVTSSSGDREELVVNEAGESSRDFLGSLPIVMGDSPQPDDHQLQCKPGDTISVSYGFGYFGHKITRQVER